MYLTAKKKAAILRGVWQMRLGEIDAAIGALPKGSPRSRKRLLLLALRAACDVKLDEAMIKIGEQFLAEFRIIPPAFYGMLAGASPILFQGQRLARSVMASRVSLALVHPQIYR